MIPKQDNIIHEKVKYILDCNNVKQPYNINDIIDATYEYINNKDKYVSKLETKIKEAQNSIANKIMKILAMEGSKKLTNDKKTIYEYILSQFSETNRMDDTNEKYETLLNIDKQLHNFLTTL